MCPCGAISALQGILAFLDLVSVSVSIQLLDAYLLMLITMF